MWALDTRGRLQHRQPDVIVHNDHLAHADAIPEPHTHADSPNAAHSGAAALPGHHRYLDARQPLPGATRAHTASFFVRLFSAHGDLTFGQHYRHVPGTGSGRRISHRAHS